MTTNDLFNILINDKPSESLRKNEQEVFRLLPELKICKGFQQNNPWHPYDVYEHILRVVDGVPDNLYLRTAALFHDIGKPAKYYEDENGIGHFPGHWDESNEIFKNFMQRNAVSDDLAYYISYLIFFHDLPGDKLPTGVQFLFGNEGIQQLYQLKRADLLAQNPEYWDATMKRYDEEEKKLLTRQINRNTTMKGQM